MEWPRCCVQHTTQLFNDKGSARNEARRTRSAQGFAWTPLRDDEAISGDLRCRLTVTDQYNHEERIAVTFSQAPSVMPGGCSSVTTKNGSLIHCEQPAGHDGYHRVLRSTTIGTRVATSWGDDDNPSPVDVLVM